MEYLDADAIFEFGLAVGRFAGETVDETDFRKWVDSVVEAIEQRQAAAAQEGGSKRCSFFITVFCDPQNRGIGSNIVFSQSVLPDAGPDTVEGEFQCFKIRHCLMCIFSRCDDQVSIE